MNGGQFFPTYTFCDCNTVTNELLYAEHYLGMVCKVWPSAAGLMAISQHLIKQPIKDLLKALLIVGHEAGLSDVLPCDEDRGKYNMNLLTICVSQKERKQGT